MLSVVIDNTGDLIVQAIQVAKARPAYSLHILTSPKMPDLHNPLTMAPSQKPSARPGITPAAKVADEALKRKEALKAWATPEQSAFHQRNSNVAQTQAQPKPLHDAENSKTPGHNPDSAHFSKKFPCTYEDCGRRFDDKKSLKRHKDAEHDYCKLCDQDFKDDEALHLHKMQSEKHVVCNICGLDFLSEPGRDRHARQVSLPLWICLASTIHMIHCTPSMDSSQRSTLSGDNVETRNMLS